MPGTTYTREGPLGDPAGRLADFARFARDELREIRDAFATREVTVGHATPSPLGGEVDRMIGAAATIAAILEGYTTADD